MNNLTRRNLLAGTAGATAAAILPFETPAKAATAPAGKQAPGWYRYKIGSIEITVATDGVARFKMAEDHVTNIKLDTVNAALAEVFMEKDMMTTPYNPIAINTGSKLAVIDTANPTTRNPAESAASSSPIWAQRELIVARSIPSLSRTTTAITSTVC